MNTNNTETKVATVSPAIGHNSAPQYLEHATESQVSAFALQTGKEMGKADEQVQSCFTRMALIAYEIGAIKGLDFSKLDLSNKGSDSYKETFAEFGAMFVETFKHGDESAVYFTGKEKNQTFASHKNPALWTAAMLHSGFEGISIHWKTSKGIIPKKADESYSDYTKRVQAEHKGNTLVRCLTVPSHVLLPSFAYTAKEMKERGLGEEKGYIRNDSTLPVSISKTFISSVLMPMFCEGKERDQNTGAIVRGTKEAGTIESVKQGVQFADQIGVALETVDETGKPAMSIEQITNLFDCVLQLVKSDKFVTWAGKDKNLTDTVFDLQLQLDAICNPDGKLEPVKTASK